MSFGGGLLLFKTLHWEQLLFKSPQVNSLEGPLIQNLLFKIHLGLDTSERKREKREGRRAESQQKHRLLWSCSQHLGILPLIQDAVPWHKHDLERGSPVRERGGVIMEEWTEH